MSYCPKCGNTGVLLSGESCDCELGKGLFSGEVTCLTIPEQYRGLSFDDSLIPDDTGVYYKKYMRDLHHDISNIKLRNKNIFLGAPAKHAKTILAYTCIQNLFRRGLPTFPLFDIMELKKIMHDMDVGKTPSYLEGIEVEPYNIYICPYLFVKIPTETTYATYDAVNQLIDRRVRRGNSTILLNNGSWKFFADNDKKGVVRSLAGDGSYMTIENKTFWEIGGEDK